MSRRRVVITGLGIISPVGNDVATGWANIVAGKSGITRISKFDAQAMACQVAGEVRDFDVSAYIPAKDARRMDVFIHYGMAAGIQAVRDAGLESADLDPERVDLQARIVRECRQAGALRVVPRLDLRVGLDEVHAAHPWLARQRPWRSWTEPRAVLLPAGWLPP